MEYELNAETPTREKQITNEHPWQRKNIKKEITILQYKQDNTKDAFQRQKGSTISGAKKMPMKKKEVHGPTRKEWTIHSLRVTKHCEIKVGGQACKHP